ncbi:DUF1304 domain-containing protein [Arthrobacter sp. PGP41]|uniref:DUF1304 family protein n=1 Tax=unclassified Arthrobacter TaxID=235627 RepID=UPI000CDBD13B|nr:MULTISPECIES: DUF1304 family protein [unclassified Arthrobacter]AUZ35558.1 DUF1304 domain-containing protein [Arthrobacter sp. PGP41]MDT0195131.1 DUF1304 family protein [Arthrobacter sp. AB6]
MSVLVQVLAVITGVVLIAVGLLEAFRYKDQRLHPIFLIKPEDTDAVRLWTVNVGFYNIVWGLFGIAGVVLANSGEVTVGRTVVAMMCIAHAILGMVLIISERRLWLSGIGQSFLPVVILWLMFAG